MASSVLTLNTVDGTTPQAREFNVGTSSTVGVTFGALDAGTNANYGFVANRIAVFGGDDDTVVAAVGPGIYRSTDAGENWTQVHTFATPNADTTLKTGIHSVVVAGVPIAVLLYKTSVANNWRAVTSTDGVTWTESSDLDAGGTPASPYHIKAQIVYHGALYFTVSADASASMRLYVYDVSANAISSTNTTPQGSQPGVGTLSSSFAVLNDRLFFGYGIGASHYVVEVVGGAMVSFAGPLPGHSSGLSVNGHGTTAIFALGGKLYTLSNANNNSGWVFHSITSGGVATSITPAVRPAGMATFDSDSRVAAFLDHASGTGAEPTVYILHATSPGGVWTVYRWNGEASVLTSVGSGGSCSHSMGFTARTEGTYFWTSSQRRIEIASRQKTFGGVRYGFRLYSQNGSPDSVSVRALWGADTDEYAINVATLVSPSVGSMSGTTVTGLDASDNGATIFYVTWDATTDGTAGNRAKILFEVF